MNEVDKKVLAEEILIQKSIYSCVDEYKSFRFNAGAGAGKTYSLIETIRYILQTQYLAMQKLEQKIICVTFTNVAVKEIRKRLGDSELVVVSTIHERLWELIKMHQPELVTIHQERLNVELTKLDEDLSNKEDNSFQVYANLSEEEKLNFFNFIWMQKDVFYHAVDLASEPFRVKINSLDSKPTCIASLIKNVANFKKTSRSVLRRKRYQDCLERIRDGKERRVEYDSLNNSDRLEYMRFSHDTLLEYAAKLVKTYPVLKRLIIDKYPFFLVDEYQDTNQCVIEILNGLDDYSIQHNRDFVVGYFGDVAQSIYDDGVGSRITSLHPNIETITKPFNRRSHVQIIDTINKIRSDDVLQEPISISRNQGNVEFFSKACLDVEKVSIAQGFVNEYKKSIGDSDLHCLVLTNKLMARLNGFGDLYDIISQSGTIYWEDINTKLLSNELEKLDSNVLLIYRLVNWYKKTQKESAVMNDFIGQTEIKLNLSQAVKLAQHIRQVSVSNLKELINLFAEILKNNEMQKDLREILLNQVISKNKKIDLNDFEFIFNKAVQDLLIKNQDEIVDTDLMNQLYSLNFEQFSLWVDFINKVENKPIIYHTYHGTKGEEYENVAIIMEHSFGTQGRDKFKNYFSVQQLEDKSGEQIIALCKSIDEYENTKNLMYVACSRAIRNLKILYLDEVKDIEQGIKAIFGEIVRI